MTMHLRRGLRMISCLVLLQLITIVIVHDDVDDDDDAAVQWFLGTANTKIGCGIHRVDNGGDASLLEGSNGKSMSSNMYALQPRLWMVTANAETSFSVGRGDIAYASRKTTDNGNPPDRQNFQSQPSRELSNHDEEDEENEEEGKERDHEDIYAASADFCGEGLVAFMTYQLNATSLQAEPSVLCLNVDNIVQDGLGFVEHTSNSDWSFTRDIRPLMLLIRGAMVFFAIAGYTAKEAGGAGRRGGGSGVVFKNVLGLSVTALAWFVFAHGAARGPTLGGFMGSPYRVTEEEFGDNSFEFEGATGWFFSFAAATMTATIATGSLAGRSDLQGFAAMTLIVVLVVHPISYHWEYIGWLSANIETTLLNISPIIDAGLTGCVHIVGGVAGLTGAWILGPRLEWESRRRREASGSKVLRALGAFIIWFGNFGLIRFSTGKSHSFLVLGGGVGGLTAGLLSAAITTYQTRQDAAKRRVSYLIRHRASLRHSKMGTLHNTNVPVEGEEGSGTADAPLEQQENTQSSDRHSDELYNNKAFVAAEISRLTARQSLVSVMGGAIAGVISASASAETAPLWSAFPIGGIGALLFIASEWIIPKLGIDDPHESFSVHGITGMWSILAAGLFSQEADSESLVFSGPQILSQFLGMLAITAWAFLATLFGLWIATIARRGELRVSREREIDELVFEKAAAALGEHQGGDAATALLKTLTDSAKKSSGKNSSAVSEQQKQTLITSFKQKAFLGGKRKKDKNSGGSSGDRDMIFEIASTPITLSEVLENRYQLRAFLKWCRESRCEENVLFVIACERFRKQNSLWRALCCNRESVYGFSGKKVFEEALTIYDKFVSVHAPHAVNLPSGVMQRINSAMESGDVDRNVFREAQGAVHRDMATSLLPAFLAAQKKGAYGDLTTSEMHHTADYNSEDGDDATERDPSVHPPPKRNGQPNGKQAEKTIYAVY